MGLPSASKAGHLQAEAGFKGGGIQQDLLVAVTGGGWFQQGGGGGGGGGYTIGLDSGCNRWRLVSREGVYNTAQALTVA